jgi:hypothetical protein
MMGIEDEQERSVGTLPAKSGRLSAAVEHQSETARIRILPPLGSDLLARRRYPGRIFHPQLFIVSA